MLRIYLEPSDFMQASFGKVQEQLHRFFGMGLCRKESFEERC